LRVFSKTLQITGERLPSSQNHDRVGILYALLAYGTWGLFPIYWKFFGTIPAPEVLSHRMIWSGILLVIVLGLRQEFWMFRKQFTVPQQWLPLLGTATLLSMNWGLYIYGVNSDRIIETSLGYFINPLVNVLLGVLILRERLQWGQWLAVALAILGVGYSIFSVGQVPWLALTLAFSFGFYGLFRKMIQVQPVVGLAVETCLLMPVAIGYLLYLSVQHTNHFSQSMPLTLLFIGCGMVTSFPLFCFISAAQSLKLSTMGFFQYIAPSIQLLLGIWLYHEPFTMINRITFGLIWLALMVYSSTSYFKTRKLMSDP
jgi:chloramphenicol-sensitive protein RarD